ncbi:MAG: Holliday junction resolvase RuvX [Thiotrichaceae bacterium]|nr:Holliday junction resolvase RuvX [Thiotrichaceae bacterium]
MNIMAFDFGLQRTGIAIASQITGIATPLCTVQSINNKPDWLKIEALLQEWNSQHLVVGLPLHTDGSRSEMTKKAERFGRQLEGRFGLPISMVNEQLSSLEAEQRLIQSRQSGRKKKIQKTDIDQLSAAIILETWLITNA